MSRSQSFWKNLPDHRSSFAIASCLLALLSLLLVSPAAAATETAPGDTTSVVTLKANFDSDNPNAPPNLTLPGLPVGDFLTLDLSSGTVRVVPSYDGLSRPVEIRQTNGSGIVGLNAFAASVPTSAEMVTVRWRSVAKDDQAANLIAFAVRASNGATLASVEYLHQGQLSYNGIHSPGQILPVGQKNRSAQQFTIGVNFLTRTTSLSIDGSPVAGFQSVPFAEQGDDVALLACYGEGGQPQTIYADDLSMVAFCRYPSRAPTVSAPASILGTEQAPIAFSVLASDPDGESISSLTSSILPAGASFTPNGSNTIGSFAWTPDFTQAGATSVTFTAANTLSGSATTSFSIGNLDRAPLVTGPLTATGQEAALLTFEVSATDPDGDAIASLGSSPLPSGATFAVNPGNSNGTFEWTPGFAQAGSYSISFTAQAGAAASTLTTEITVTNLDRAPVATAPVVMEGAEGAEVAFEVSASDPDADAIASLTSSTLPAGASFTPNGSNTIGSFAWIPDFTQAGVTSVTFTASNALSGSATTEISIANIDRAPVVTGSLSVTGPEGALLAFIVSVSDPDGDAIVSLGASPLPAGASFATDPGNTGGTFSWTPGFEQAGTYSVTFTAQAGTASVSLTTAITIANADRAPVVAAPAVVDGEEGGILLFDVSANDPDGDALSALGADLSALPSGHSATFAPAAGNASGTFRWPMAQGEAGSYVVTFSASNGSTGSAETRINVAFAGTTITGELIWTPQPGEEGTYSVTFTATNAANETGSSLTTIVVTPSLSATTTPTLDGRTVGLAPSAINKGPIVSSTGLVSTQTKSTTTISATATESTPPLLAAARRGANTAGSIAQVASGIVAFTADISGLPAGNNAIFTLDQEPVVAAPSTFTINPGDALSFSVSVSDPDGDAIYGLSADLTVLPAGNTATFTPNGTFTSGAFAWTPRPEDAGSFAIVFTSFNALVGKATTNVTVRAVAPARIFLPGSRKIRLSSNKPFGCLNIEPVNAAFTLFDIDLTSIRMVSIGTGSVSEIAANTTKTAIIGDRDGNQIEDLQVCFSKDDFRALFSLLRGSNSVPVIVRGRLVSGALFQGSVTLDILAGGGALQTVMSPNPLNPSGVLSFITKTPGAVRVSLFDINGRFIRTLWASQAAAPGAHEIPVEARGADGRTLSSGVYFFRIESKDGVDTGRFTVLK